MSNIFSSVDDFLPSLQKIRNNKKIVFTNGCFDILHPGHIKILEQSSKFGDILIVGLNTDASVKRIKGSARPVIDEKARALLLSKLKMVDYVVMFDQDTPVETIRKIKPDVLVKGAEYVKGQIVGEEYAEKTVTVKMEPGYSTTSIIKKIKEID